MLYELYVTVNFGNNTISRIHGNMYTTKNYQNSSGSGKNEHKAS